MAYELSHSAIEVAAKAIYDSRDDKFDLSEWQDLDATDKERYICDARNALTAAMPHLREECYCCPAQNVTTEVTLASFLAMVADGEGHGWETEFAWLRDNHENEILALETDIVLRGIQEPILVGPDGRCWDGHHRVYVAHKLNLTTIPVRYV